MKWRSSGGMIVTQQTTPSRTGEFSKRLLLARGGVFSCAKYELLSVALGCAAGDMAVVSLAGALDVSMQMVTYRTQTWTLIPS